MASNGVQGLYVAITAASTVCYLIYKRYEPNTLLLHTTLLLLVPLLLVLATTIAHTFPFPTLLTTLSRTLVAHWTILTALTLTYRLSPFHPLAPYPGPLLARASKLYHLWIQYQGKAHVVVRGWHERYGEVVRIGPNELSFSTPDAVPAILTSRRFPKGPSYDVRAASGDEVSIDSIKNFDEHAARRKVWTRALAPYALKDYESIILGHVELLMRKLAERVGEVVDVSAWMSYYGYDFMGQLVFARDFGMMKAGADVDGLWHMLDNALISLNLISTVPWLVPFLQSLPVNITAFKKIKDLAATYAEHRIRVGSQYKDLWYRITGEGNIDKTTHDDAGEATKDTANTTDKSPNLECANADALAALVGGSDTVASAITTFWYCMMRHPACCDRLRLEIDEAFPDPGELPCDFRRLAGLPYLNACINESMRVLSPVLPGLQRRVEPGTGGAMIASYFVPEGTSISAHFTSLYHNPSAFSPLPDTFWPDRWLDQPSYTLPPSSSSAPTTTPRPTTIPNSNLTHHTHAFAPFSIGPQACPGKHLALMQLRCLAAVGVRRFTMRPAEGYELGRWEEEIVDAHSMVRGPLPVVMELRKV